MFESIEISDFYNIIFKILKREHITFKADFTRL